MPIYETKASRETAEAVKYDGLNQIALTCFILYSMVINFMTLSRRLPS